MHLQLCKLYTQGTQPIRCCSTSCAAMYAQDGLCQIWLVCSLHSRRCPCSMQVLPLYHALRACLALAASLGIHCSIVNTQDMWWSVACVASCSGLPSGSLAGVQLHIRHPVSGLCQPG